MYIVKGYPHSTKVEDRSDKPDNLEADPQHECAACGKAAAFKCSDCSSAPAYEEDKPSGTSFCSKECQGSDWKRHAVKCKRLQSRIKLARAVDLFHAGWERMCKLAYNDHIDSIEDSSDGKLRVCPNIDSDSLRQRQGPKNSFFSKTPAAIPGTEEEQAAILMAWPDEGPAVIFTAPLLQLFLDGELIIL